MKFLKTPCFVPVAPIKLKTRTFYYCIYLAVEGPVRLLEIVLCTVRAYILTSFKPPQITHLSSFVYNFVYTLAQQ